MTIIFLYVAVPAPKLYVQLSPVRISVDVQSVVWLGAFLPHVARALKREELSKEDVPQPPYMDVRMESIMPKVCFFYTFYIKKLHSRLQLCK